MNLLLDTHAIAWLASDHPKHSRALVAAMPDPAVRLLVSAVTVGEFTDLVARDRLPTQASIEALEEAYGLQLVDFPASIAATIATLPDIHRDPVDRMLIAHAIAIDATLVTVDKNMRRYPVKTLW